MNLTVVKIPINSIKIYEKNARTHSQKQIEKIAKSIKEFGFNDPIAIDHNNQIIAGHGRLAAAKLLEMDEVPVIKLTHLSAAKQKAYIIAHNKIALEAGWDFDILKEELDALNDMEYDLEMTGFDDEINALMNPNILKEGLTDEDDIPEIIAETITKTGDIWILGNHRLMCGDSTNPINVSALTLDFKPIIMITDPPYGVNHDPSWRDEYCIGRIGFAAKHENSKGLVTNDDNADWKDAYSLFTGNIVYIWHSAKFTHLIANNLIDCDFELICQIIWSKQHFSFGRGDYHWQHEPCWYAVKKGQNHNWQGDRKQTSVWEIESLNPIGQHKKEDGKEEKTGHSTQKPIECMLRPILNNTTSSDIVYDPFGGSGSTLIACEKTNRKCLMMEISPYYCDVIIKRWENFTGQKASREVIA